MAATRSLTDKQEKAIAKAYGKGAASADLAADYGVHVSTIRNAVLRQGVTLRPRGGVPGKPRRVAV